jgi:hypothetical protein
MILLAVLAVVSDVETGALEHEASAGGKPALGNHATLRTWHLGSGIADLAIEFLELVTRGTTILVSRHLHET